MTRYAEDSKERVRDAVDIVDLVSARVPDLRRRGANSYFGRCPFHEERTASFHVRPLEKTYFCFGCQAKGDPFTFVMETEGAGFAEALELLAGRYGVPLAREREDPEAARRRERRERLLALLDRAAAYYTRYLWETAEAAAARDYLLGRGLGEAVLREYRVGYAPSAWDRMLLASRQSGFSEDELLGTGLAQRGRGGGLYDRFRARVMFPLADERGRVRGFGARALRANQRPKYLNSADGEVFHKGRQLFGLDHARRPAAAAGSVVLAEGYTDVLALRQADVANAVGLMGTALTEDQVAVLARTAPTLVLALDADRAGQEAMLKAAELAARRRLELRVVALPEGADPADLLVAEGDEALRARCAESQPFVVFRVERILAEADVASPEGRDRALDALAPVVSALPPSVLREELVRRIAGVLQLSEPLVGRLLAAGGAARPPRANGRPRTPAALGDRQEAERAFLALCLARPDEGARALARIEPDGHFTSELTRRAARHLAAHPRDALAAVAPDDRPLADLLAELAARYRADDLAPESLEHAELLLELARLQRAIVAARAARSREVSALAAQQSAVKRRIDAVAERMERGA